ncbi:hypothetical protein BJ878DRAFT_535930 [Calycina marina]|uniref:Zn(2)-C6 fungal-type domain-containing protein n=1 Tax=Calycina marina TaxID=1763456 RepID=A0A9P8CDA1_9HELO|nr:hypothetical protein BJ878DRAFT_535930 [Calycina marina]
MNPAQDSGSPSSSGAPSNQRKERGAIAAQACDTCRTRKQKCDEQRPKCSLCQRMKLECRYREPQPTKKDKTLVEILDRLTALESKIDRMMPGIGGLGILPSGRSGSSTGFDPQQPSPASQPSFSTSGDTDDQPKFSSRSWYEQSSSQLIPVSSAAHSHAMPYRHASAAHRMMTWPAIQQLLIQTVPASIADMKVLEQPGSAFVVEVHRNMPELPLNEELQSAPFVGMQSQAARTTGGSRVIFQNLTKKQMLDLVKAYFDTFNFIYPFLDRQAFISDTLNRVHTEGFDGESESVIALLVFALGELSIQSARGESIEVYEGRESGIRGGTAEKPPGLAFFNEARKRMGFVYSRCDLESVQIFSLTALYYESCSRHMDFWRMTVAATSACMILVTCNPLIDWTSQQGEMIRRIFWHCVIMDAGLYLELDLPPVGIMELEGQIPLPHFAGPYCEEDHRGNQSSHSELYFASQLALRRLCATIHHTLTAHPASSTDATKVIPSHDKLKLLASQLGEWRSILPAKLQWDEDQPESFPVLQRQAMDKFMKQVDPNLTPQTGHGDRNLFTADLNAQYIDYPYVYDIQVALLRTRYYYAKYMVYRPYVYKALHFPNLIQEEDAQGVAECLRCCIKWPLALSPASRHKRMIPYLFCWSQNFLTILIIVHMTQHNDMLRNIRAQLAGPRFEAEIDATVETMIDWIRDLKNSDPISSWCWKILASIYQLEL